MRPSVLLRHAANSNTPLRVSLQSKPTIPNKPKGKTNTTPAVQPVVKTITKPLKIASFCELGRGVGRLENGRIVFVDSTMPGDIVNVDVKKSTSTYIEASVREFLTKSKDRIEPPCQHANKCSGCSLQFVPYAQQLELKHKSVASRLRRALNDPDLVVEPVIAAPQTQGYRNKVEFSFSPDADGVPRAGFIGAAAQGVVDIQNCLLPVSLANEVLMYVKEKAMEVGMDFGGQIRRLTIKSATRSISAEEKALAGSDILTDDADTVGDVATELMVVVVFRFVDKKAKKLMEMVGNRFMGKQLKAGDGLDKHHSRPRAVSSSTPRVTSLYMSLNKNTGKVVPELTQHTLYRGDAYIVQQLEHLTFQIYPSTFFQPNPAQAAVIYALVRDMAQLKPTDTVYDLYTGMGTIGLFLAPLAKKVVGVDYVSESIASAKLNARDNNICNAHFLAGDMAKTLNRRFTSKFGAPDVIVADPPRQGMDPEVVRTIMECAPRRIVYVSCDGATLARDLKQLCTPADVAKNDKVQKSKVAAVEEDAIPTETEWSQLKRVEEVPVQPTLAHYRVKRVVPVDQFPHSAHYETVVLLERVDEQSK